MKPLTPKTESDGRRKTLVPRLTTLLIALVVIVYFFPHPESQNHYRYEVDKPWNYEQLIAPFDITVPRDSVRMKAQLDSLNRNFVKFYVSNPVDVDKMISNVDGAMQAVRERLNDTTGKGGQWVELASYNTVYPIVKKGVHDIIHKYYDRGGRLIVAGPADGAPARINLTRGKEYRQVDSKDLTTIGDIISEINRMATPYNLTNVIAGAKVDKILEPTAVIDTKQNDLAYSTEERHIKSNVVFIQKGQTIIEKGTIVTAQHAAILDGYQKKAAAVELENGRTTLLVWVGQALYVMILLSLFVIYIIWCEPKVWQSMRSFAFVIGLTTVFFVLGAIMSQLLTLGLYVVPFAVVPILTLVFFNGRLALWNGVVLALLTGGMANFGFEFIFLQVAASAVAVFSLRDLTQRSQLLKTSGLVGLTYIVGYVAVQLLTNGSFDGIVLRMLGVLVLNAGLTSTAYVLMFPVERMCGFVSNVTLVELTDVNAPLLRQLSDECPGTFNHVVAVANLAGDAARQIGANSLLTRAGAMYHDIGKLANPMFFTENQHGVNPHDGLSPQRSAEIIINHVIEGLSRAEKAGLPPEIRDFIAEHHGRGKAKYFYYTYCKQHPDEDVDPAPFTYPGPNPRSRETSVLMMADSVEAASRSLREYTPKAISELVNKIIDGQIAEGLHNDSPLSFNDVRIIKDAFTRRLMTMYHTRIAYPDAPTRS